MLSPDEAVRQAQRLIDDGYPFHAHEVFEAVWKSTPEQDRGLWQGLAQLAVGLTHVQRGNSTGAMTLLRRSADRIESYSEVTPYGLDVAGLASYARALAVEIERDGAAVAASGRLRPRLCS